FLAGTHHNDIARLDQLQWNLDLFTALLLDSCDPGLELKHLAYYRACPALCLELQVFAQDYESHDHCRGVIVYVVPCGGWKGVERTKDIGGSGSQNNQCVHVCRLHLGDTEGTGIEPATSNELND